MKYNQPYGITDPNAGFINGDPSVGRAGSIPPAESIEYPQREIVNVISGSGLVPSNADQQQLAKAIQSGQLFFGLDIGSANHMVTTLAPTPNALVRGMFVLIYAIADNTGASDLTTNGITKSVTRPDGTALIPGDIKAGAMVFVVYDGTRWQLPSPLGSSRLNVLTQPLDLYVNGAIGNDANDGVSNTPGHALLTVQRAVDISQTYLPSNFGINIRVADGTYNEAVSTSYVASPAITVIGNNANPDNVIIGLSGTCTYPKLGGLIVQGPNLMNVQGVCVRSGSYASDNPGGFISRAGGVMNLQNTSSLFAQGGVFHVYGGSTMNINGNHKFKVNNSPGTGSAFIAYAAGNIYVSNSLSIQFTFEAGVVLNATALAIDNGVVMLQGHHATWAGATPTGFRYAASLNGIVDTQGGGLTYIPGTVAGTTATGGQYA